MTKSFDTLVESILNEMMPAMSEFGSGVDMGAAVSKKVEELPGKSQHWGPLQKLSPETRTEIINAIIKNVFSDNEDNTYSSVIDTPEQLKDAIKDAIREVASTNPQFKAGGKWAVQFLADRLSNKELLGNVKYTTAGGEEAVQKEVTQKEVKAALNKAVEDLQKAEVQKAKIEKGLEKAPATRSEEFSSSGEYILIPPSAKVLNSMAEEDRTAYDALVDSGAEESSTGRELVSSLKRSGVTVSNIDSILNNFIRKGILSKTEEEAGEERPIDIEDSEGEDFGFGEENVEDYEDYL